MAVRPSRPALGIVPVPSREEVVETASPPSLPSHAPKRDPAGKVTARIGKVQLSGYIDIDYKRQLDIHAAREGITMQSIIEEMYDLYATAHGLHRLGHLGDPKSNLPSAD
jgi:hypothetical protein